MDEVTVNETAIINILLSDNATGNIKITFNNNETAIPINNSIVHWKFTPIKAGNFLVEVEYIGDENYFGDKINFTLIVNKLNNN